MHKMKRISFTFKWEEHGALLCIGKLASEQVKIEEKITGSRIRKKNEPREMHTSFCSSSTHYQHFMMTSFDDNTR